MKLQSSALLLLLFMTGIFSSASCARGDSQGLEGAPAVALKGGGVVYSAFVDYLNKGPHDNDFTKFAGNPENYAASIKVGGDKFIYTFTLNSYRGDPVLGGPISFSWSEADGKIERAVRP